MALETLIDIAGALALTALLAESYGAIRRKLVGDAIAPVVLGVLFGLMAAFHMYHPLEPFDGLIIDMRNVPVALAGAFLGWRGLLPCLAIAMGMRFGIGGVGMEAGLAGMIVAGGAGMYWARRVQNSTMYKGSSLILLGLMMSLHQVTALLLPNELLIWFLTHAAGPVLALNLLSVPLIAALLERENRRLRREQRLQAAITTDPASGLLLAPAWRRDVTQALAAKPMGTFAGFMVIDPVGGVWDAAKGMFGVTPSIPLDGKAFANLVEFPELVGLCDSGRILVPLSSTEVQHMSRLKGTVRAALRETGFARDGHLVDLTLIEARLPEEFMNVVNNMRTSGVAKVLDQRVKQSTQARSSRHRPSALKTASIFDVEKHSGLFAKAEFLLKQKRDCAS